MKYNGKIISIFILNAIILLSGTSFAYYNTKTFGFDENAKIVDINNEKIIFMDCEIEYNDIKDYIKKVDKYLPDKPINV